MSGDQVSEAVAAAFGRTSPASEAPTGADRAVSEAFGRRSSSDDALLAELEEAGYPTASARRVLSRVADGYPAEEAAHGGAFESGLSQAVYRRGAGILRAHGVAERQVEAAPTAGAGASAAVTEARNRLVSAYVAATPGTTFQTAQRYADASVREWLDSGTRQGYSEQQVLEGLERQRAALAARALTRKGGRR